MTIVLSIDKEQGLSDPKHELLGSSVVEQVTVNHLVAGSNPARAAIFWDGGTFETFREAGR